jgi:flavin reductase
MIDAFTFKLGMRRLAAGVCIVTTLDEETPHGLVATSVSSVCAEPRPSLLVCVNRSASAHDRILNAGSFCVNVLSDGDDDLADRFAAADRARRFENDRWTSLHTGAPALEASLASFDCRLTQTAVIHSHTIMIGEVLDLRLWRDDIAPLVYINGHFDRLGVGSQQTKSVA